MIKCEIMIETEQDVAAARSCIEEIEQKIYDFEHNSFATMLKTVDRMKFFDDYYPGWFSYYTIGSHDIPRITFGGGRKVKAGSSLPIIDRFKTYKKSKITHYVLYRDGRYCCLALKDNEVGPQEHFSVVVKSK